MPSAAVNVGDLLEVVWVSLVAGVGVTTLFSLVVHAGGRSGEARREGSRNAALVYAALSVLFMATFAAVVIFGVQIMLTK